MSIEDALDDLNIRKRSRDLEGLIVTKAIDDDDLRHPNQRFQIAPDVLLLVIGQYQRGARNPATQRYQKYRRMLSIIRSLPLIEKKIRRRFRLGRGAF